MYCKNKYLTEYVKLHSNCTLCAFDVSRVGMGRIAKGSECPPLFPGAADVPLFLYKSAPFYTKTCPFLLNNYRNVTFYHEVPISS